MKIDRRKFLLCSGAVTLCAELRLRGEHRIVSEDPLEVESDLASMNGRYTRLEDFYVRNHHRTPSQQSHSVLRIEGQVAKSLKLTLMDLSRLKARQLGAVLECAGNPVSVMGLISNGMWGGWAIQDLLDFARPSAGARYLHLFGRDGYARSVPIERVNGDAMLVTSLEGQRLSADHGAPWRALFPGWYGMDSVKWLERVAVSSAPLASNDRQYVEMRPSAPVGVTRHALPPLQIKSIITSPSDGSMVHSGAVEVRGLAWCGEGSIAKVEISKDGEKSWEGAELSSGQSRYEWSAWRASLSLRQTGPLQLVCRASDSLSRTQPEQRDADRLDGYAQNWYHRIAVVVT